MIDESLYQQTFTSLFYPYHNELYYASHLYSLAVLTLSSQAQRLQLDQLRETEVHLRFHGR